MQWHVIAILILSQSLQKAMVIKQVRTSSLKIIRKLAFRVKSTHLSSIPNKHAAI